MPPALEAVGLFLMSHVLFFVMRSFVMCSSFSCSHFNYPPKSRFFCCAGLCLRKNSCHLLPSLDGSSEERSFFFDFSDFLATFFFPFFIDFLDKETLPKELLPVLFRLPLTLAMGLHGYF